MKEIMTTVMTGNYENKEFDTIKLFNKRKHDHYENHKEINKIFHHIVSKNEKSDEVLQKFPDLFLQAQSIILTLLTMIKFSNPEEQARLTEEIMNSLMFYITPGEYINTDFDNEDE